MNFGVLDLDKETHLGWWAWIHRNIKKDIFYTENDRGIITNLSKSISLKDEYRLEAKNFNNILLNFTESSRVLLCKWWCMNLLLIIILYIIDKISDIKNGNDFY